VGIIALPLSMALAIAVGAPPQHGLYAAIFAGFSVSLLGGGKVQVTGPTAAFVVILAPIVHHPGMVRMHRGPPEALKVARELEPPASNRRSQAPAGHAAAE
jgi:MFS superfamily sulfate permease-like transporter